MTNNPTIDGVSREDERHAAVKTLHDIMQSVPSASLYSFAEAVLDAGYAPTCKTCGGSKTVFQLGFMSLDDGNDEPCPDCSPAVERQESQGGLSHAFSEYARQFTFRNHPALPAMFPTGYPWFKAGYEAGSSAAPEVAALQSTIARLEARIAELESGRGEPVAWKFKERVWATGLSDYVWRDQLEDGQPNEDEREIRDITPLFTAPPAPVAEKYQERVEFEKWIVGEWPTAPLRYVRDALPKDDPLHGTYCDGYLQRAWVGWQARACLDATAALNGPAK